MGIYDPPDFRKGRDKPNDRIALALQRNRRIQARAESLDKSASSWPWNTVDFGPHRSLQDFIRPGRSNVNGGR